MKSSVEVLEYNILKELVASFAQTTYGKRYIEHINPKFNYDELVHSTSILETLFESIDNSNLVLYDICIDNEISEALYSILNAKQIYHIYEFVNFVSNIDANLSENFKTYIKFTHFDKLKTLIAQAIDESGFIKDNSTKKLSILRNRIKNIKEDIISTLRYYTKKKGLQNILLDTNVFLKNSRFTILVKPNYNEYIKARKVDISKAGFFVEPYEIFEKNNHLEDMIIEETKEIQKILTVFTNLIRKNSKELIYNTQQIALLDSIMARFMFSKKFNAHLAIFDRNTRLVAKNLKHPILLDKLTNVVPNDIQLNGTLIITGPNTGGKTVFIKQIGLAVLSAYSGIPVCADCFCVGEISNVFAVIGDEQSTESLSTFSSNMVRIKEIIGAANKNSLILLDEPGSGTSPDEAYAIVYAIIVYLSKKESLLAISTHYRNLVYKIKELNFAQLAAFEFDEEHLLPTFKLIYGKIGKSFGIEIMQKYLNKDIVQIAREVYLSKESQIMDHFEKELNDMLKKKETLQLLIKRYKDLYKKLHEENTFLKDHLINEQNEKIKHYNNLINSLKKEISNIIKTKDVKPAQRLIAKLEKNPEKVKNALSEIFTVGDTVKLGKSTGIIVGLKSDYAQINIEGKIVQVQTSALEKKPKASFKNKPDIIQAKPMVSELNIIGMFAFEAELSVLQFLDYAIKNDIKEIRIIHGKGSGILRDMVRNLLKEYKAVEYFSMAPPNLGSDGATIVKLK